MGDWKEEINGEYLIVTKMMKELGVNNRTVKGHQREVSIRCTNYDRGRSKREIG